MCASPQRSKTTSCKGAEYIVFNRRKGREWCLQRAHTSQKFNLFICVDGCLKNWRTDLTIIKCGWCKRLCQTSILTEEQKETNMVVRTSGWTFLVWFKDLCIGFTLKR